MTTSEAIPLLRDLIKRIAGLRHRPAYNADYRLWEKETLRVLAEGFDLSYLARFERFKPQRLRDTDGYESFLRDLDKKKRLLEEIVLAHKSLLCGCPDPSAEPPAAELRPEDMTVLPTEPPPAAPQTPVQPPAAEPAHRAKPAEEPAPQAAPPTPQVEAQAAPQPAPPEPPPEPQAQAAPAAPAGEPRNWTLPSEAELREQIRAKERLIEETQESLALLRRQLDVLGLVGGLLEAQGETLQELAGKALGQLGVEVALSEQKELFIRQNGHLIPLEMEAAQGSVPERAMRRLISRLPDGPFQGCRVRGLLLGSSHLETPPEERLRTELPCFEERLVQQAESFDVCLLSLKDIFKLLAGQAAPPPEEFRQAILNTVGEFVPE